ncbi:MAG: lycopene cyclase family protein, partial [Alphaproteobacteria bacterium]
MLGRMSGPNCDLAIIGGGLSGGLLALAARRERPDRRVILIEAAPALGGAHLWSFIDSDIEPEDKPLLEPLINYGWRAFSVVFPLYKRALPFPLYSIRSDRFDAALREVMPAESILTGRRAVAVSPTEVRLEDGTLISARGVV